MDQLDTNNVTKQQKEIIGKEGIDDTKKAIEQKDEESTEPDAKTNVSLSSEDADQDFTDMYEESFRRLQEGEVVKGKIVQIDKEHVLVDIGYKSEGHVRISEFLDKDGNLTAKVGDTIDVLIEGPEDEDGVLTLSKEKATKIKVWDDIKNAYDNNNVIEGVITKRVKGGLSVDIGGVQAFLPGSQIDLKPVRNLDQLLGNRFEFKVLKYSKRRRNVVISRRAILEERRETLRKQMLSTIYEGKVVKGVVKNITDYGVFIDLGGVDGLLHITDMSWGRVNHPSEMFAIGDDITVKVLTYDAEKERVSLGLKQLTPDPWTTAGKKYPVGTHVTGKVVSLTDYGAFVELEKGVEGLIHVSEMSWTRKIRHPSSVVSVGDMVEAVVLNIDPDQKRISLGMKQVVPNPWDIVAERYPVGSTIEGKIKNITEFGLFIGIDEGIDGLVHISDISWTKRIGHPSELYKKGDKIQAKVLNIDKENERFSLGIKQLYPDPWETIEDRYVIGDSVTGKITNITEFGVFVEIEEGIEGLIHVSELSSEKIRSPAERFQVGDVVSARVININGKERRIGLSIRRLEDEKERELKGSYLNSKKAVSTLGEILKENLEKNLTDKDDVY
nr:30S ribosomal protein S1 [Desulfobacterales bacterium]